MLNRLIPLCSLLNYVRSVHSMLFKLIKIGINPHFLLSNLSRRIWSSLVMVCDGGNSLNLIQSRWYCFEFNLQHDFGMILVINVISIWMCEDVQWRCTCRLKVDWKKLFPACGDSWYLFSTGCIWMGEFNWYAFANAIHWCALQRLSDGGVHLNWMLPNRHFY